MFAIAYNCDPRFVGDVPRILFECGFDVSLDSLHYYEGRLIKFYAVVKRGKACVWVDARVGQLPSPRDDDYSHANLSIAFVKGQLWRRKNDVNVALARDIDVALRAAGDTRIREANNYAMCPTDFGPLEVKN